MRPVGLRGWITVAQAVAVVAAAIVLASCGGSSTPDPVAAIEAQAPLLGTLGVDAYWSDGNCQYIAYKRGTFNATPGIEPCEVMGLGEGSPLDEQARADMRAIHDGFANAGLPVSYLVLTGSPRTPIGVHSFFVADGCRTYRLQGDVAIDPEVEDASPVSLRDGWVLLWTC